MKGTAILFQDQKVRFVENIDQTIFDEMKQQCGCTHCNCKLENKVIDFGSVSPVFWHEDEIDWDYGY
jgi:hypothetical protein